MKHFSLCCLVVALLVAVNAQGVERLRQPVAAGVFYPEEPDALLAKLNELYAQAEDVPPATHRLAACVVPHAGYDYSGTILAKAFESLKPGQYDRVIVLAPGHMTEPEGCSIVAADAYVTPFGPVYLDQKTIRTLCYSSNFTSRNLQYNNQNNRVPLHEVEHSIEVILPMLQERLQRFWLIPIIVGNISGADKKVDAGRIRVIADRIRKIMTPRTLLVVSTDYTHYGNSFSYTPFRDNIAENMSTLDTQAFTLILSKDLEGFKKYLRTTKNPICGASALQILMELLPESTVGSMLDYDRSMTQDNDGTRSISYASMHFYDMRHPPNDIPVPVPEAQNTATAEPEPVE